MRYLKFERNFSLSCTHSHSLLTHSGFVASRQRKIITKSASYWIAFLIDTLMCLHYQEFVFVYPRGCIFGQVRADLPDKDRALAR